jgi:hypothetical protein
MNNDFRENDTAKTSPCVPKKNLLTEIKEGNLTNTETSPGKLS